MVVVDGFGRQLVIVGRDVHKMFYFIFNSVGNVGNVGPTRMKDNNKNPKTNRSEQEKNPDHTQQRSFTFVEISNGRLSHTNRHRSQNWIDHGVQTNLLPCVLLGDH